MVARVCVWPPTCRNISVQSSIYIHVNVFRRSLIKIHLTGLWEGCFPLGGVHLPAHHYTLRQPTYWLCTLLPCVPDAAAVPPPLVLPNVSFTHLSYQLREIVYFLKKFSTKSMPEQNVLQRPNKKLRDLNTWKEKSARGAATCIKEGLCWTPWKHPLVIYACLHFSSPPSIYVSSRPFQRGQLHHKSYKVHPYPGLTAISLCAHRRVSPHPVQTGIQIWNAYVTTAAPKACARVCTAATQKAVT